jgi:hypothetical protein
MQDNQILIASAPTELQVNNQQNGQDQDTDDASHYPLVPSHSPGHWIEDPPTLANVVINIMQLQDKVPLHVNT